MPQARVNAELASLPTLVLAGSACLRRRRTQASGGSNSIVPGPGWLEPEERVDAEGAFGELAAGFGAGDEDADASAADVAADAEAAAAGMSSAAAAEEVATSVDEAAASGIGLTGTGEDISCCF